MAKSKRQPKNFFLHLVDEYILFRRDFYFESTLLPKEIAQKIQGMRGKIREDARIIPSLKRIQNAIKFEIGLEEETKYYKAVTAEIKGIIYKNDDGLTVIEGAASMTGIYWILCLFVLFIGIITTMSLSSQGLNICSGLNFLFYFIIAVPGWAGMYVGRNKLYDRIRDLANLVDENDEKTKTS